MSDAVLLSEKVRKIYGQYEANKFEALKGIDLEVDPGEFVCIMGPSGAGKSTLLNLLSTIDIPTKGFVYINGTNVKKMSENEMGGFRYKNLGFIFQEFHLIPSLTIAQNIAVPLSLHNVKQSEIDERVEKIANRLGIGFILKKLPSECSGGQIQRTAIARSLITNPRLIIADEPTGNLDSKNSHEILSIFKEMNEKDGTTILMVTHDATIASYSTRVIRLVDGEVETVLERGDKTQKEYFFEIVEANAQKSQLAFLDE